MGGGLLRLKPVVGVPYHAYSPANLIELLSEPRHFQLQAGFLSSERIHLFLDCILSSCRRCWREFFRVTMLALGRADAAELSPGISLPFLFGRGS